MALIAVNKFISLGAVFTEDPVLSKNRLFINYQAYNTTTLTPNWQEQYVAIDNSGRIYQTGLNSSDNFAVGYPGMALEKGTLLCWGAYLDTGNNDGQARFVWDTYHRSMDFANYPVRRNWSTNTGKIYSAFQSASTAGHLLVYSTTDLASVPVPSSAFTLSSSVNPFCNIAYEDVTNAVLYGITAVIRTSGDQVMRYNSYDVAPTGAPLITLAGTSPGTGFTGGENIIFFMGVDSAGFTTWMIMGTAANNFYSVYRVNPTTFAATALLAATAGPATQNITASQMKMPSNLRRSSDTRRVFYSCHYNSTGVLTPVRFVWDTTAATVVATNCTMVYPGADTYATYATMMTVVGAQASANSPYGQKGHQFTVGGVDYITFFIFDKTVANGGQQGNRWATANQRAIVTYSIGTGTGDDVLTYHSRILCAALTDMPRGFLPINTAGTQLAVPTGGNVLQFYNFSAATGWVSSGPYPTNFYMIGLDQTNRLWGLELGSTSYSNLHMITPTMPITVSIVMASSSYNYSGTAIVTSAAVNAYDSTGSRMATTITLTIDGASMLFTDNSTKTLQVATSASADTTVSLSISGGGVNNIIASINV